MQTDIQRENHYLRAACVFAVCLAAVFGLPFVAVCAHSLLPNILTNYLFFSTQLLFPYEGLVTRDPSGSHFVFSPGVARALTFVHWGLITAAFTWVARRVPMRYVVVTAIATIVLVGIGTHLVFGLFGVHVELDGP